MRLKLLKSLGFEFAIGRDDIAVLIPKLIFVLYSTNLCAAIKPQQERVHDVG